MKRRLFVFALLAAPRAVQAQPADWQTIVGRDLRFRLEMPAPVTETKAAEIEKGHASERIAWAAKCTASREDEHAEPTDTAGPVNPSL